MALLPLVTTAQNEYARQMRAGNRAYADSNFAQAEAAYRLGASNSSTSAKADFNLGDALYRQERYEEALEAYQSSLQKMERSTDRSNALHNMGNTFFQMEKYEEAARSYAEALKLDPEDEDTRYNLAQTLRRMQQPPPQQQQQQSDQQEQSDQEEQQDQQGQGNPQEEQEQQDSGESGDQDEQEQDAQDIEQTGDEAKPLNKEEAERLLDALEKQEEALQKKLQKENRPKQENRSEKDW